MPSRFLNNIKINDSYELPPADGTEDQIITTDGAGQLSFVDQSTINAGNAEHVVIYAKNTSGSQINKGTPVYITGTVGATDTVTIAPADAGNSSHMPAVGLLDDTLLNNEFGYVITGGFMDNITTDPIDGDQPASNDTVYVKVGGGLTLTKPIGPGGLIQNIAKVGKVSGGNSGSLIVSSILRTNDIPNLTAGKIWVGTANNTAESTVVHLDETNGRMGIGTTSPAKKLTIGGIGSGNTDGLKIEDPTNTAYGAHYSYNDGSTTVEIGGVVNNALRDCISIARDATRTITIDTSERVGIGTTSPTTKLHVYGDLRLGTTGDFYITQSPFVTNTFYVRTATAGTVTFGAPTSFQQNVSVQGDLYVANGSSSTAIGTKRFGNWSNKIVDTGDNYFNIQGGNFGIGTTSPSSKLQVNGDLTVGDDSTIGSFINVIAAGASQDAGIRFGSESNTDSKAAIYTNTSNSDLHFDVTETTRMLIDSGTGNVGIGTTSPVGKLDVKQAATNGNNSPFANPHVKLTATATADNQGFVGITTATSTADNYGYSFGAQRTSGGVGNFKINYHNNSSQGVNRFLIDQNGNVGIGTTSPSPIGTNITTLDIQGSSGGGFRFGRTDGIEGGLWTISSGTTLGSISNIPLYFRTNNNTKATILTNGNFGIGETSPSEKLHVKATSSSSSSMLYLENAAWAVNMTTGIAFKNGANYSGPTAKIYTIMNGAGNQGGEIRFATLDYSGANPNPNTTLHDRMTIDDTGNVGIGTTSPDVKLEVESTASASGIRIKNTNSGYASLDIQSNRGTGANLGGLRYKKTGQSFSQAEINYIAGTRFDFLLGNGTAAPTNKLSILENGNVGIGTTSPSEKLEVNGHIKAVDGYKGYVSHFHSGGFDHFPRNGDGANPMWIPSNYIIDASTDQYYNVWVPLYAGRIRKIILKNVTGTPTATVCTFRKKINGVLSGTTYAGTVTGGGAAGMKVTFDFGTTNFTFNAEDEVQIGIVTGVAPQPPMRGVSYQIWYEYNIT